MSAYRVALQFYWTRLKIVMELALFAYQAAIISFMDQKFEQINGTQRALATLQRFESLSLPNMPIDEKYKYCLVLYSRDLDMVAKMYRNSRTGNLGL